MTEVVETIEEIVKGESKDMEKSTNNTGQYTRAEGRSLERPIPTRSKKEVDSGEQCSVMANSRSTKSHSSLLHPLQTSLIDHHDFFHRAWTCFRILPNNRK